MYVCTNMLGKLPLPIFRSFCAHPPKEQETQEGKETGRVPRKICSKVRFLPPGQTGEEVLGLPLDPQYQFAYLGHLGAFLEAGPAAAARKVPEGRGQQAAALRREELGASGRKTGPNWGHGSENCPTPLIPTHCLSILHLSRQVLFWLVEGIVDVMDFSPIREAPVAWLPTFKLVLGGKPNLIRPKHLFARSLIPGLGAMLRVIK